MIVEIFKQDGTDEWVLEWEEPTPGSTASSKLKAVVMQVLYTSYFGSERSSRSGNLCPSVCHGHSLF